MKVNKLFWIYNSCKFPKLKISSFILSMLLYDIFSIRKYVNLQMVEGNIYKWFSLKSNTFKFTNSDIYKGIIGILLLDNFNDYKWMYYNISNGNVYNLVFDKFKFVSFYL